MRDILGDYFAIIAGLVIGSVAHFGRIMAEGKMPTPLQALGYLMQLGLVGLMAVVITKKMGVTDEDVRALATALLALSTNEVVQYAKRKFWKPLVDKALPE